MRAAVNGRMRWGRTILSVKPRIDANAGLGMFFRGDRQDCPSSTGRLRCCAERPALVDRTTYCRRDYFRRDEIRGGTPSTVTPSGTPRTPPPPAPTIARPPRGQPLTPEAPRAR